MSNWFIATDGDDNTGDGSIGTPYKTFAKVATVASGGDTTYIRAGTYDRQVVSGFDGGGSYLTFTPYQEEAVNVKTVTVSNSSYVKFQADDISGESAFELWGWLNGGGDERWATFIDGSDHIYYDNIHMIWDTPEGVSSGSGAIHMDEDNGQSYITFINCEIENRCNFYGSYITVEDCYFHDGIQPDYIRFFGAHHVYKGNRIAELQHTADGGNVTGDLHIDAFQTFGFAAGDTHDILIEGNTVESSMEGQFCMLECLSGLVYDLKIKNNLVIVDTSIADYFYEINDKISGGSPVNSIVCINNTFVQIGEDKQMEAINIDGGTGHKFQNNIFYNILHYSVNLGGTFDADYNCFYGTSGSNPNEANGLWDTDPLFVDSSSDYNLLSSSPCINAALEDSDTPDDDIDGVDRGTTPDIGAYEYVADETAESPKPVNTIEMFIRLRVF